jgi:hypothetical protein
MTIPMAVEIRFHHWNEILKMRQPDAAMKTATVFWHFGRGMALAGTGKDTGADAEYKIVSDAEAATPPDVIFQMPINNKAKDIMKIAKDVWARRSPMRKKTIDGADCYAARSRRHSGHAQVRRAARLVLSRARIAGRALLMTGDAVWRGESVP